MPRDIDRRRLEQLQAHGAALVEVLPHEEFEHEHLPGAINLPLEELCADSAEKLLGRDSRDSRDKGRAIIVYCQATD
jgi:rhodanese-related sulfurtransferase